MTWTTSTPTSAPKSEVRDLGERLVVVFVIRSDAKGSGVAGEETLAQVRHGA